MEVFVSTSPSPDIDRLSMERRLRRLEAGIGSGGSGGFGLSFPDFDQFPDNEVSKTPNGLVLKYSIDDLGSTGATSLNGVGLKALVYAQFIPNCGAVISYGAARIHISRPIGYISKTQHSITFESNVANRKLWDDWMYHNGDRFSGSAVTQFQCQNIYGFGTPNGQGDQGLLGSFLLFMNNKQKWAINAVAVTSVIPNIKTLYPCYSFGASNVIFSSAFPSSMILWPGSITSPWGPRPNLTIAQPQDMPVQFQNIYPRSWWS